MLILSTTIHALRANALRAIGKWGKPFLCIALMLPVTACRTLTTTMTQTTTRDSVHSDVHFFVKNTIQHDSIYIHERSDTVFVERWSIRYRDRIVAHTDTVCVVRRDSIPYPVEVPIEVAKPIPRFYRTCTTIFLTILALFLLYLTIKIAIRAHFHF